MVTIHLESVVSVEVHGVRVVDAHVRLQQEDLQHQRLPVYLVDTVLITEEHVGQGRMLYDDA